MFAALNRALVLVFFLVLASFAWFAIGAIGTVAGLPMGFEVWLKLWTPLFQPLLGVFMAGAIVSSLWGWWQRQRSSL
ncbi:MAG: hypothetical protein AAFY57_07685 [Cyanobacteria bacterium J06642_2]